MESPARRAAEIWIGAFIGAAAILVFLYPDGYQQDGGYHFLFARWAWVHPELLVGVWSRPAFTLLYSLPAQFGYPVAKLFTVLICTACAWQTWRLANDLGFVRPWLAIPLLVLQPSFLLLCSDTLTEPLFALIFVTALRLHHAGRVVAGMGVASLMILARPEGLVLGVVWAVWVLLDPRDPRPAWKRIPAVLLLASGAAAWWLAAWLISGDPLYIKHNWPPDWTTTGAPYGSGPIWAYAARLPEMAGRLLQVPLVVGLAVLLARRRAGTLTSPVLAVLIVHSALWSFGGLGSAGYARYMVTVAPAMALIALTGWNVIADRCARLPRGVRVASAGAVLALSAAFAAMYVDGWVYSRDARLVAEVHADFMRNPRPVKRLVWSQAYMAILFDADPWSAPRWGDRVKNLEIIAALPSETLVFWEAETGPAWFHLTRAEFERAGFELIVSREQVLEGRFVKGSVLGFGGTRRQEMSLLYRP